MSYPIDAEELAAEWIKPEESLQLKPYQCPAGKLTIGYGRNLEDNGITEEEAEVLLENDIETAALALKNVYPWYTGLNYVRQAVLIDMVYNLGFSGFMKFRHMLKALAQGNYRQASVEMLNSAWSKQVGKRAARLAERMYTGKVEN